jgi:DNA-directed RNA polymerase subunit RPC12/RpoP
MSGVSCGDVQNDSTTELHETFPEHEMSKISFHCSGCKRSFEVPMSMAGTQAKCTTCGTVLTVPTPGQQAQISFSCPQCGKDFHASSELAGKQARCGHCQSILTVPGLGTAGVAHPNDGFSAQSADSIIGSDDVWGQNIGSPATSVDSRPLLPQSAEYARVKKAGGGFRPKKWMVVVGWLAIWAFLTLVGLGSPDFQLTIFKVGTYICLPAIALGAVSCLIKVVATDPLGALTMLVLGGVVGPLAGPFAPRVGRMAREAGVPGVQDQDLGCAANLLVAASVAQALLFVNLLLVYVL